MHYMPNYPHVHHHDEPGGPGLFEDRDSPLARDFRARAFTIGIGGPVGSGKTALLLALCRRLRDQYSLAVVTNDIFTKEDGEFLVCHQALPAERIAAQCIVEQLDGDRAAEPGIAPPIHVTHPARAERGEDFIRTAVGATWKCGHRAQS